MWYAEFGMHLSHGVYMYIHYFICTCTCTSIYMYQCVCVLCAHSVNVLTSLLHSVMELSPQLADSIYLVTEKVRPLEEEQTTTVYGKSEFFTAWGLHQVLVGVWI